MRVFIFRKNRIYIIIQKEIKLVINFITTNSLYKQKQFKDKKQQMNYMDVLLSYTESSDPEQTFQLLDILGQGAYGSVSKALHKQTGQLYAIKILPATSVTQISVIKKQIAILRDCNDEHIVKYYGSYFKDNNLWIVMEYCMAGSITDIVNITQNQLNQTQIASILELVLKGLKYLHDRKKIHRDIKAANILLDQNGTAKLADFGVSTQMMYTNARHNTHIGSPYWMSPEVIKYSQYNQKTDIWSLGVTAIELAEGVVPYSHLKPFMAMWTMKDKPIQGFKQAQKWSAQFNDFVRQCLQINPDLRPNAEELLRHSFIKKNSRGKEILSQLVHNSMAQIENFRAGQFMNQQPQSENEVQQQLFLHSNHHSNEYQTSTMIIRRSENKKNYSIIQSQRQTNSKSLKKQNLDNKMLNFKEDYVDDDCGSVIVKNDQRQHSRNCSEVSVSSVVVKNLEQKNNDDYLQSYVKNMQAMHSKETQFKQNVQQRINQIQHNFVQAIISEYKKTKSQLSQFFKTHNSIENIQFQSPLLTSHSILQYLYKQTHFQQERQKLQDQFKQKYLSSIQPVDNNYISMMLESANEEGSGELNHVMQIIDGEDNCFLKNSLNITQEQRKKSQSSADSPMSILQKRKNQKKLVIQEALDDPVISLNSKKNSNVCTPQLQQHMNNFRLEQRRKNLENTPSVGRSLNNTSKYKDIFINSGNFTAGTKNFIMSTANDSNIRGQKRIITTQPHEGYDYQNQSLSTLTKLNYRNLKQFYEDPVVLNNLKQLTQQSEELSPASQTNPFQIKKNSISKEIKPVKSKEKDKEKFAIQREKQRATHIAHTAIANNKVMNNSSKKIKVIRVIEDIQKSPDDLCESSKAKGKKSKSKNKQTASTTIPFGSVGNMGALQLLPVKLGKSKQKKPFQIPVKSGPFSKIKNKN